MQGLGRLRGCTVHTLWPTASHPSPVHPISGFAQSTSPPIILVPAIKAPWVSAPVRVPDDLSTRFHGSITFHPLVLADHPTSQKIHISSQTRLDDASSIATSTFRAKPLLAWSSSFVFVFWSHSIAGSIIHNEQWR